jgi:hypothetical protein
MLAFSAVPTLGPSPAPGAHTIQDQGYAIAPNGDLDRVNNALGLNTTVGNLGISGFECLAQDFDGVLWSTTGGSNSAATNFYRIDPAGPSATLAFSVNLGGTVQGLAVSRLHQMYAIVDKAQTGVNDQLMRIDLTAQTATLVGGTGQTTLTGLAVTMCDTAYVWHAGTSGNGLGLMNVSLSTGAAADVNPSLGGGSEIGSLEIDENGGLLGAGDSLYRINTLTGALTQFGASTTENWSGLTITEAMTRPNGIVALESDGDVWHINAVNGARRVVGNVGVSSLVGAARTPLGSRLMFFSDVGADTLVLTCHPEVNAPSVLDSTIAEGAMIAAATTVNSHTVLLIEGGGTAPDAIRDFNPIAHTLSAPVSLADPDIRAVVDSGYGSAGSLIVWDTIDGLGLAPGAGGPVVDRNPSANALVPLNALAIAANGRLFGLGAALYRVDLDGTPITQIGSSGLPTMVGAFFLDPQQVPSFANYCTAQTNSAGCVPSLSIAGPFYPSASTNDGFFVNARQLLPNKNGLLFYGTQGRNSVTFLGGFLCVKPPTRRTFVQDSGGIGSCGGRFDFDFNAHIASGFDPALVAGQLVNCQYWSRDPAAASTTNLTAGLEFEIAP